MSARQIINHFDNLSEAPKATQRLRRLLIDLGVRGKLLPQDQKEQVSKEFLKEKVAADLPPNWRSLNFGEHCDIEGGNQPPKSQFITEPRLGYIQLFQIRDLGQRPVPTYIPKGSTNRFCRPGEILIGRYGASIGKIFRAPDGAYNVALAKFIWPTNAWLPDFAFLLLKSDYLQNTLASATRSAQAGFNKGDLASIDFPLPPEAEQRRIIAKLDELMMLCDQLDAARKERESYRDRLALATYSKVANPNPDTFEDDVRFMLDVIPSIAQRANQIQLFREVVLNLAVLGRLVLQDPNDEPATNLIARIAKENTARTSKKRAKASSDVNVVSVSERSFDLPTGWAWARLGSLAKLITSGSRDWARHYSTEGAIFLRMGNLSKGHYQLRLDNIQRVNAPNDGEGTRTRLEENDILVSITGEVGMLGLIPAGFGEAYINQHTAMVRLMPEMQGRYIAELFRSPFAQLQFNEPQRGIKNSFRLTDLTELVVPLPPLAEQHRIVARIDELMLLFDRLEGSLQASQEQRSRLLAATLGTVLVSGVDHEAGEAT